MKQSYEVIVIGCGGIGSAAAYWLALRAGNNVLAIEQFRLGHDHGSSQDHSRIIRRSYHNPDYIALTEAAYETWHHVEAESGVQIVEQNLDECVLCDLCVDAAPEGTVRVVKLYEK